MTKQKVLFLCTGNSARSQMAEAFLKKYAGDQYEAHSAGLEPKGINPYTVRVMEEIGISLDGQHSKSLKEYLAKVHFQYFFTVCDDAEKNCPQAFLMSAGRHDHWSFEDPAALEGSDEEKLAKFREVRDQIDRRIKEWLAEQDVTV
ncbi:MAG: arsenate reductase ArsC [Anaerolineae bacterium]|nr:arsenate reductase ArsC [Anaerolineae bacterium]